MKAELHWYTAQVITGSKQETARKPTDAGMEVTALTQILHERRHGKWWSIRRVVFLSYVPAHTGMIPYFYYFISSLPRVTRLLSTDGPESVSGKQMGVVRLSALGGRDFDMSRGKRIDGKTVITSGSPLELEGKIVEVDAREHRATVSVPILGEAHQVDVDAIMARAKAEDDTNRNPKEDTHQSVAVFKIGGYSRESNVALTIGGGEVYILGRSHPRGPLHAPRGSLLSLLCSDIFSRRGVVISAETILRPLCRLLSLGRELKGVRRLTPF